MMQKKTTGIVAVVLAGLLAVGGGGAVLATTLGGEDAPAETIAATDPATDETVIEEMPEPLVAETPETLVGDEADAAFVAWVRDDLPIKTGIPNATDEQLIAAGHEACEQLLAGVDSETIRLVEGEEPVGGYYMDTSSILTGGQLFYCPETIETIEEAEQRAQEEAESGDDSVELP